MLDLFLPEEISVRTCGNDQVIITDRSDRGVQDLLFRIQAFYISDPECEIMLVFKDLSQGKSNRIGFQSAGSYLVQQWLEGMVIMPVEHQHLHLRVFETFG